MDGTRKEKKWGTSPAIPSTSMDIKLPQSTNSYLEVKYKERGHTPTL
jgi:hypothetical protein